MGFWLEGLLFIIVFSCILFLAYVTTKFIAGKSMKAMKGRYLNVVDTISLGMDKRLHLVKAGEQYFLIATSGKSVELLSRVNISEPEEKYIEPSDSGNFDFKNLLNRYVQMYKGKKSIRKAGSDSGGRLNEEQSGRIKNNLSKLREINQKLSIQLGKDGEVDTNDKNEE